MGPVHRGVRRAKERNFAAQGTNVKKSRFPRVVDVRGVVRDFVHPINELGLQWRPQIEEIFAKLREFRLRIIPRMLDDAFAHFESEIQAGKIKIALLEMLDDAKSVQIVIELPAMRTHQFVQLAFASVAERRMANIVN